MLAVLLVGVAVVLILVVFVSSVVVILSILHSVMMRLFFIYMLSGVSMAIDIVVMRVLTFILVLVIFFMSVPVGVPLRVLVSMAVFHVVGGMHELGVLVHVIGSVSLVQVVVLLGVLGVGVEGMMVAVLVSLEFFHPSLR